MSKISIIIVNWNTKNKTKECIQSVIQRSYVDRMEVIVVDNGSTDGSKKVLENEFPEIELIKNDENLGFASACNQGIKKANGEYILLLNSDATVLEGAINKCIEFMNVVPNAGALGCKVYYKDDTLQYTQSNFFTLKRSLYNKCVPEVVKSILPEGCRQKFETRIISTSYDVVQSCDYVKGSFMLLRAQTIEDIGYLDESFFMYSEEADFCFRLKNSGWNVYYYPNAKVVHEKEGSSENFKMEVTLQRLVSRGIFLKKHYPISHFFIYSTLSFIYNIMLYIYHDEDNPKEQSYYKLIILIKLISPYTDLQGKSVIKNEVI